MPNHCLMVAMVDAPVSQIMLEENVFEEYERAFTEQFHIDYPDSIPVRVSMSDYRIQDWLTNIPLYAAERITST